MQQNKYFRASACISGEHWMQPANVVWGDICGNDHSYLFSGGLGHNWISSLVEMITMFFEMVDLVTIEFLCWWKWSQWYFKWWTESQMNFVISGNYHNGFLSGGLGHKWILSSVEMITMIFLNGGLGHTHFFNLWNWSHDFFSIVTYSILTFFSRDLFHPYESVYGNNHKNMSNSTVTKKFCDYFHPYKNLCD